MLRVGKSSWTGAFLAAAVIGSLSAAVAPSQAAAPAGHPRPATAPVVVASGLHNPRAVRIQPDGSLLVTEAGSGPATACTTPNSQCLGLTASLYRIKGAWQGRVVTGLPSQLIVRADGSGVVSGPIEADAGPTSTSYRVLYGLSGTPDTRAALGPDAAPLGTLSIAKGRILGDLGEHEALHDPDAALGNNDVYSNPWHFARDGADFLATDAGANDLIRIHPDGTTETAVLFPNNVVPTTTTPGTVTPDAPAGQAEAVPTGIVRGRDGAFYITDMSGIRTGLGRIWRYVPGSAPTVFATGLTGSIDVDLAPDGDLIVLSYTQGGTSPTQTLPGALIRIDRHTGAATTIDTGGVLNQPTGLAVTAGGDVYVTNNTQGTSGQLLKFPNAAS
ncbi:ScyD/ScyE family protein [Actinacidiphila acidipaludis]|uniref:ScyD/ScyE family protein n=1 Tax=Actinacidiphila acidipaludis TaxID=2873382 RepID=A0ABS7QKS7_9ACTN|nr:ScyD/ScyE family protein [Streptomyces acidipaludis]MBY8882389.1 ScyD/ScyE family protein [Streptomyces acidipaludis]